MKPESLTLFMAKGILMASSLTQFKILGQSRAMQQLGEQTHIAAKHWDTILITGERGTGKELLANAIHYLGPGRGGKPVTVDCGALHESTLESLLFGHEKGAFTGAYHRHIGFLESAHQGTIFFDEISTLPRSAQSRFLRFMEEGTVIRVGGKESIKVRTRVVAATNRNLAEEVAQGRFLADLYDRINILPLTTPPLRERGDDILLLFHHFLDSSKPVHLTEQAQTFLRNHPFPGNVRELRNLCRRLNVFHKNETIEEADVVRYADSSMPAL
jgi:DNA-binding NtrC family response regulator